MQVQQLVKGGCAGVGEASVARAQPRINAAGNWVHVWLRQPVSCLQHIHTSASAASLAQLLRTCNLCAMHAWSQLEQQQLAQPVCW